MALQVQADAEVTPGPETLAMQAAQAQQDEETPE